MKSGCSRNRVGDIVSTTIAYHETQLYINQPLGNLHAVESRRRILCLPHKLVMTLSCTLRASGRDSLGSIVSSILAEGYTKLNVSSFEEIFMR